MWQVEVNSWVGCEDWGRSLSSAASCDLMHSSWQRIHRGNNVPIIYDISLRTLVDFGFKANERWWLGTDDPTGRFSNDSTTANDYLPILLHPRDYRVVGLFTPFVGI